MLKGVGSQDPCGAFLFSERIDFFATNRRRFVAQNTPLFSSRGTLHHELSFWEAPPSVDTRHQALTWILGTSDANAVLAVAVAHQAGNKGGHHSRNTCQTQEEYK